jgi:flagellar biogenesis protein FliO
VSTRCHRLTTVARRWLCSASAAICAVILSCGILTGAETQLGRPIEDSEPLPISPATAKRSTAAGTAAESSYTKSVAALAVVVVGIGVALACVRKVFPGLAPDSARRIIHVLAQSPLGAKGTVYVVRCGPRVLIVGAAAGQLTTLAEIADPDEIDEFVRLSGTHTSDSRQTGKGATEGTAPARQLKGQVDGMLDRIDSWKVSS